MNMIFLHGVLAASLATAPALPPRAPCDGKLPNAFIETVNNTPFAQTSRSDWIVSWGKLPLSDWQTALLAEDDEVRERLERTWRSRGAWVYAGLTASVVGAGISSSGWLLYGQNEINPKLSLSMALTGLAIGLVGTIIMVHAIERSDAPMLTPSPIHQLTRREMQILVDKINETLAASPCLAN